MYASGKHSADALDCGGSWVGNSVEDSVHKLVLISYWVSVPLQPNETNLFGFSLTEVLASKALEQLSELINSYSLQLIKRPSSCYNRPLVEQEKHERVG